MNSENASFWNQVDAVIADEFAASAVPLPDGKGTSQNGGHDDEGHDDDGHDAKVVIGTNRADEINSGGGPQEIYGGNAGDTIKAGGGPDLVYGGNGGDKIHAGGGPDEVHGGNAKDVLVGGCGPDVLAGGNGKDLLTGGKVADVLSGGRGADVFVYLAASDAPGHGDGGEHDDGGDHVEGATGCEHGGPRLETITDFEPGLDRIDLSAIVGLNGFSDGPTVHSIWVEQDGPDTRVLVDTDGNLLGEHPEDMVILLLGVDATSVDTGDFLL